MHVILRFYSAKSHGILILLNAILLHRPADKLLIRISQHMITSVCDKFRRLAILLHDVICDTLVVGNNDIAIFHSLFLRELQEPPCPFVPFVTPMLQTINIDHQLLLREQPEYR